MPRLLAFGALMALGFAGCDRSAPTVAQTSTATSTPVATLCSAPSGSTDTQRSTTDQPTAFVTDLRYRAEGCPRVVFEFRDQESGYEISYVQPPFSECGSGAPISTDTWGATAFMQVKLQPAASADTEREGVPATYNGPRDIAVRGPVLKHLKVICDFEADFSWLVALDDRHDFTVRTFDDPSRIVIDISEG